MTPEAAVHEEPSPDQADAPIIGTNVALETQRFGTLYKDLGFGIDLPTPARDLLLTTLAIHPPRNALQRIRDHVFAQKEVGEKWIFKMRQWCPKDMALPDKTVGLNVMREFMDHLTFSWAYHGLTLNQVGFHPNHPSQPSLPALPKKERWTYYQFAWGFVADPIVNLRTTEMMYPEVVWQTILSAARAYGVLTFGAVPQSECYQRKLELALALYEQFWHLKYEEKYPYELEGPVRHRYFNAISQRRPAAKLQEEYILRLDPDEALREEHLDEARHRRVDLYHDLLDWLLQKTVGLAVDMDAKIKQQPAFALS